jgi:pyridoxal phosphate enzyme (YggS family)
MTIADNLKRVQERIARAAESAGRAPSDITLVGVTKYVGAAEAAELVAAGCHDLGESRPQELWKKAGAFQRAGTSSSPSFTTRTHGDEDVPAHSNPENPSTLTHWHLIGHLQRNKIARTLPLVTLIHSVDSERLLAAINEAKGEAPAEPRTPVEILLEVNTSGESAKHGLAPNDVEAILAVAPNYPHVEIRGLMTMAALEGGPYVAARNFASLRELRDRLKSQAPSCVKLNELSMGMSGDFEVAIKEGATIVRVGSLLWENET